MGRGQKRSDVGAWGRGRNVGAWAAKRTAWFSEAQRGKAGRFIEMFGKLLVAQSRALLADLVDDFRYGTSNKSEESGYPALRIPNVIGGALDLSELKLAPVDDAELTRLRLRAGDVLFASLEETFGEDSPLEPACRRHQRPRCSLRIIGMLWTGRSCRKRQCWLWRKRKRAAGPTSAPKLRQNRKQYSILRFKCNDYCI